MSNDVCFKVANDLGLPPYSAECDHFTNSNVHPPPLVQQEELSLQLKLVASSVDAWSSAPFECSCVLEDRFLLLGHREGIKLIDMEQPKPPTVIIWTRVRQIRVIESCGVILMVSDKSKPVRCYSYEAVLKLIYSVLLLDWSARKTLFDVPLLKDWQQVASRSALNISSDSEEEVNVSGMNGLGFALKERLARKQKERMPQNACFVVDSLTKPFYVCGNIIPQEFHYKLPESKEALDLQFYQTNAYLFLAILHRDKIVLWQKKRDHPLRHFYRFKVFWIPTEAKAISFGDDRNTLRHIIAVFGSEATAIELRDCQVETIPIDTTLRRIYETTWREQSEPQESTLLATVPPIQWTNLLQLPFFPHLPPTSLSTEYSIPPSYTTVITTLASSAPPEPVALAASAQLFFATFGAQSFVIDISGSLYSTQVFRWSEPPLHIEFIQLDQWYAIGFGHATVERMDMKSGRSQKIMHGVPVKFLGRWKQVLIWSCAAKQTHVYMLKNQ